MTGKIWLLLGAVAVVSVFGMPMPIRPQLWPGGEVTYEFGEISPKMKASVMKAIEALSEVSCVKFMTERKDVRRHGLVKFTEVKKNGRGSCTATMAMSRAKEGQTINLASHCDTPNAILRYLMYTLGARHPVDSRGEMLNPMTYHTSQRYDLPKLDKNSVLSNERRNKDQIAPSPQDIELLNRMYPFCEKRVNPDQIYKLFCTEKTTGFCKEYSPKPTEAEPTEAEPTEAEPTDAEPTEAEPTEAEPTEAEPTEAEPTEAESTEAESTEAESTEAESTEAEPTEAEPTEAEPTEAEPTEEAQPE